MSSKTKNSRPARKKEKAVYSARDKKRIVIFISVAVITVLFLTWGILLYAGAVNTLNPVRSGVQISPDLLGMEGYENISVPTEGGVDLAGWYLPASKEEGKYGDKVIIMSHNYESSRESTETDGMVFFGRLLEAGYDVVTFDYSGSGESMGRNYTFGCREKDELLAVIDFVHSVNPEANIALCGWAFGAAAAISAGCESDLVSVVISDSSYTDLDEYFKTHLRIWTKLPAFLFDAPVKGLMEGMSGCDFSEASPISSLQSTSGKSFFFIHAANDTLIPTSSANNLFSEAAKNNKADIWIVNGTNHILSFIAQEDTYVNKVLAFLEENF